jgi:hypothetical protein
VRWIHEAAYIGPERRGKPRLTNGASHEGQHADRDLERKAREQNQRLDEMERQEREIRRTIDTLWASAESQARGSGGE